MTEIGAHCRRAASGPVADSLVCENYLAIPAIRLHIITQATIPKMLNLTLLGQKTCHHDLKCFNCFGQNGSRLFARRHPQSSVQGGAV